MRHFPRVTSAWRVVNWPLPDGGSRLRYVLAALPCMLPGPVQLHQVRCSRGESTLPERRGRTKWPRETGYLRSAMPQHLLHEQECRNRRRSTVGLRRVPVALCRLRRCRRFVPLLRWFRWSIATMGAQLLARVPKGLSCRPCNIQVPQVWAKLQSVLGVGCRQLPRMRAAFPA